MRVALLHAPDGMDDTLGALPEGVQLQHGLRRRQGIDLIVAFVSERDHLDRNFGWLVSELPADGSLWVAWPKRASGVTTDMSEGAVRDVALPVGWVDVKVCAIDATWSGLKLVLRKELRPELPARSFRDGPEAWDLRAGEDRLSAPAPARPGRPVEDTGEACDDVGADLTTSQPSGVHAVFRK